MKSETQIGVILKNEQIQIINWLTNQIILIIEHSHFDLSNWNERKNYEFENYFLCIRDLYHLVSNTNVQFDCYDPFAPIVDPYAVIVCRYSNKLYVYHVRFNEYKLVNTIKLDENIISCDIIRGD
jgi:hypothetical protein